MPKKYEIKEIKKESKGFINEKRRTTSQDSEGNIAVSDWQPSESKAVQQSRERLGQIRKENNQT